MTLAFDFHPEAQAEFAADVDWYDDREAGVGGRFAESVRAAVDAAVGDPDAWAKWPGWDGDPVVRSKGVADFPYRVVYFVEGDQLTIVAVAHAKRRPATGETASAPSKLPGSRAPVPVPAFCSKTAGVRGQAVSVAFLEGVALDSTRK